LKKEYVSDREELARSLKELESKLASKLISSDEHNRLREKILRHIELIDDKLKKEEPRLPQEERRELYRNDFVQSILHRALENGGKFEPVYKVGAGFVYPVDGDVGAAEIMKSPIIQRMVELDIFEKELYKRQPTCHRCGSSSLLFQIACPKCRSQNMEVKNMIEHYRCGYIAPESEFLKGLDLFCPKCGKKLELIGKDYRRLGVRIKCLDCGDVFSLPHQYLSCIDCGESLDMGEYSNIRWQHLYTYKVNPSLILEIRSSTITVDPLIKILESKGWKVKAPGKIRGESGIYHDFWLIASKGDKFLTLDLAAQTSEVGPSSIIALFAKNVDVKPVESFIIAIPGLNGEASKLASYYKIGVVEGKTLEEVTSAFEGRVS
jgi:uncharacterized OB-fold protein